LLDFWLRFLSSFFCHSTIYESCISGIFGVIYFGPMHSVLDLTLTCCSMMFICLVKKVRLLFGGLHMDDFCS
jgi:hypothetical protein